jgi:hypothetical protein
MADFLSNLSYFCVLRLVFLVNELGQSRQGSKQETGNSFKHTEFNEHCLLIVG